MSKDTIYRQDAIDAHCELCTDKDKCSHNDICPDVEVFNLLPSVQPEYTENEEKVLTMMFTIVKNILDLQGGYMDIDYTSFGHSELFYLSKKLGIDY